MVEILLLILAVYVPVRLLLGPRRSEGSHLASAFDRERMQRQSSSIGSSWTRTR